MESKARKKAITCVCSVCGRFRGGLRKTTIESDLVASKLEPSGQRWEWLQREMADRDARCWNDIGLSPPPAPTPAILILTGGLISTECFLEFPMPGWNAETGGGGGGGIRGRILHLKTTVSVTIKVTFAIWQLLHCALIPNLSKHSCGITLHSVFPPHTPHNHPVSRVLSSHYTHPLSAPGALLSSPLNRTWSRNLSGRCFHRK